MKEYKSKLGLKYLFIMAWYVLLYLGLYNYFGLDYVLIISLAQILAKILMIEEGLFKDD